MSGTVSPNAREAIRVDELTDAQIRTYLDSYQASIWRRYQDRPSLLYFHKYKNGVDLVQLDTLYYYHFHRSSNESAPWHSKDSTEAQQYVMEIVAWSLLRSSQPNPGMRMVKTNSEKDCQKVLHRAPEFLTVHNAKLRSSVEVTAVGVEGCMQILCELQGVGVREASAIVAAWTRYGVYMSEELARNLLRDKIKYEETWDFWRRFYEQAIEALKTKKYKSGREMEKVAWSMYHPAVGERGAHSDEQTATASRSAPQLSKAVASTQQQQQKQQQQQQQEQPHRQEEEACPPASAPSLPATAQAKNQATPASKRYPVLPRIDTLSPSQLAFYCSCYQELVSAHVCRKISFTKSAKPVSFAELDTLYQSHTLNNPFVGSDSLNYLCEVIAWTLLRHYTPRDEILIFVRRKNKNAHVILQNAADVLRSKQSSPGFDFNNYSQAEEEVKGCMRELLKLRGVRTLEASAIVASWTPIGIFMSDELLWNLCGKEAKPDRDLDAWRAFYKKAFAAMKKGGIKSGKQIERVAWSLYHGIYPPPAAAGEGTNGDIAQQPVEDASARTQQPQALPVPVAATASVATVSRTSVSQDDDPDVEIADRVGAPSSS